MKMKMNVTREEFIKTMLKLLGKGNNNEVWLWKVKKKINKM